MVLKEKSKSDSIILVGQNVSKIETLKDTYTRTDSFRIWFALIKNVIGVGSGKI